MLTPLTDRQKKMIVNNVTKVLRTKNINHLSKQSYNYLNLCSGFIAHYNHYGFMDYYYDTDRLANDILLNEDWNSNHSNFRIGDKDYEYYKAKGDVYKEIVKEAKDVTMPLFARC